MTDSSKHPPETPEGLDEAALSAYLDDELDEATRTEVAARLEDSPEWRVVMSEVRETRDALRALPMVDGSPEFWARVQARDAVIDLGAERAKRRGTGWKVAAASVAAAIVIVVAVAAVPERQRVRPAVAAFTDAHATRSSLDEDVVSHLASVGVPGFRR